MIRSSKPEDTAEIVRLAQVQFARLRWDLNDMIAPTGFLVSDRSSYELSGAMAYVIGQTRVLITHLWVDDGFRGWRAAVELSRSAEKLSEQVGKPLAFEIPVNNKAFAKAVATAGYAPTSEVFEKV